jgi:hypothetical protein
LGVSAVDSTVSSGHGRAGEQLGGALQADRCQAGRSDTAHVADAAGFAPGHPPFAIAAHAALERAALFAAGGRHGDQADRAALGGFGALDADIAVVGPLFGLEGAGRARQQHDDLALHVQARVVVATLFRGDHAVADEHQRRVDRHVGRLGLGRGQVVLAELQVDGLAVRAGDRERPFRGVLEGQHRHGLQVAARAIGGLDAEQGVLGGHIVGGDVVAARARLTALHGVVGQESHVGADGFGRRLEAGNIGLGFARRGGGGLRRSGGQDGLGDHEHGGAEKGGAARKGHQARLQGRVWPAKGRNLGQTVAECRVRAT